MKKLTALILFFALAAPLLTACAKTPETTSSSSGSSSEQTDVFVPELRVCGAEVLPQRSDDYVYDYEGRTLFRYTFIEEDEDYIYFGIRTGEEYYLPKSMWYIPGVDLVRINKATGKTETIDTRVSGNFTTINDNKIYYYKIVDNVINAVFTEYDTKTGKTCAFNFKGMPSEKYIALWEENDHIDWASQSVGDAGNGKYTYSDPVNKCERVVDTNNDKTYTLPENGFICDYDGKYYYGEYDGEYEDYSSTPGPETFRLMVRKIGSNNTEEVCRIDFSGENASVDLVGYEYVGNGYIFIWDKDYFGKFWIFNIRTGELMLKEAEEQYQGLVSNKMESYWTWAYDEEAFYFAECVDKDYNFKIQKVSYDGLKQETIQGIHIHHYDYIEICNGYIYVYGYNYRQKSETITRYDMDGSNPVEILYNKYEVTEIHPHEDDEE